MNLILDEEQTFLQKTARQMMAQRSPVGRLRTLRDTEDPTGFSRELWSEMAELGWVGMSLPEAYGGLDMGFFDLCLILEEAGRQLMPEPFLSTVLLGSQALLLGDSEPLRQRWLPRVATGDALLTLAFQEPRNRYALHRLQTRAVAGPDGVRLSGEKFSVLDGHVADALIIPARASGSDDGPDGVGLYLVEPKAQGVEILRQTRVDGRNAAIVRLRDVRVSPDAVVASPQTGGAVLSAVVDRATVGLSAEMLGLASEAFSLTLDYLKERVQFGVPIGSFQALQHRAARLFIELELARSAVRAASRAVDDAPDDIPRMASLAKARAADLVVHVTNEAVQMHGGVGMTDEFDIGFYMKRARAAVATFGDAAFHRDRWATLRGY